MKRSQSLSLCLLLTSAITCLATQLPLLTRPSLPASSTSNTELLSLHRRLIEIESISGNEQAIGDWLASYLVMHGFQVQKQYVTKDRLNILAYVNSNKTDILVTSHIDTVPPYIPYSIHNGSIWGRGSVDAKACVAAQIIASLRLLQTTKSTKSLSLLYVVGEEVSGTGMKYFSANAPSNYSAVLFGEPTEGRLASGHKGMMSFTLSIEGKAAHSGYPWLGIDANRILLHCLNALEKLEGELPADKVLGNSTINFGMIQGGVANNVVPASATAEISIRIASGSPEHIRDLVQDALKPIKSQTEAQGGHLSVSFSNRGYGPVRIDTDIPDFDSVSVNYGTDIPNLEGKHKQYLYGPGSIQVCHGPNEHLKVKELEDAAIAYEKILEYLLRDN
ncbi:Zn-dependent exopeptidase [Microthyrium microscopicum]|uniref:Zn-dependent exopeptidase n=1 Tax=Microthyrium microscopicum TaxID=703497 RepID=A0A6A6U4B0_9PEZI|nr:Zn-dependent exopeptidase [Microthyrium microscopicum]